MMCQWLHMHADHVSQGCIEVNGQFCRLKKNGIRNKAWIQGCASHIAGAWAGSRREGGLWIFTIGDTG